MTLHTNGGHHAPDFMPKLEVDGGFVFVTCKEGHRLSISATIERLIDMLDTMELDPDLEDSADDEPWLGWPNAGQPARADMSQDSDREGDWADAEPTLGATENHPRPLGHGRSKDGAQNGWSTGIAVVADGENEPSLGAPERHPVFFETTFAGRPLPRTGVLTYDRSRSQEDWAAGDATGEDREDNDEREPDQDDEYSTGWDNEGSQGSLNAANELEPELGWPEQVDQVQRSIRVSGDWHVEDGEPYLSWGNHPGMGVIAGDIGDDREEDDEREHDPAESGIGDADGLHGLDWAPSSRASKGKNPTVSPELYPVRFTTIADGKCCEPALPDGSRVLVDKGRACVPGDFVLIFRDPTTVARGDHVMKVKRLVSQTDDAYSVEMLNPPARITYHRSEVLAVWHCELAPADYIPGPRVTDGELLAKRAAEMRKATPTLTYAERAHRMPDGTIMRAFVASNDAKVIH